jgi:hypothetical protein
MQEVRKRPECRNIKGVAIIRPVQMAAHHPNWDAVRVSARLGLPQNFFDSECHFFSPVAAAYTLAKKPTAIIPGTSLLRKPEVLVSQRFL